MNMSIYGIVNKKNIVKLSGANTTNSRYMVRSVNDDSFNWNPKAVPVKRKLTSREAARSYKRALKNPQNWSIVDLRVGEVVR
jgi:hypothetical protein